MLVFDRFTEKAFLLLTYQRWGGFSSLPYHQSLVRKSIQAAMGMTNGKRMIPAYEDGMRPPDGSGEWRFGNLRFDWGQC